MSDRDGDVSRFVRPGLSYGRRVIASRALSSILGLSGVGAGVLFISDGTFRASASRCISFRIFIFDSGPSMRIYAFPHTRASSGLRPRRLRATWLSTCTYTARVRALNQTISPIRSRLEVSIVQDAPGLRAHILGLQTSTSSSW